MKLPENPYILIFLYKFDPDIRDDEDVLLNIEFLKDKINEFLNDKPLNYEIHLSSIYSMISNEPEFSKLIKDTMNVHSSITSPDQLKINELGKLVESALNAVVQLSSHLMQLEQRLENLEKGKRGKKVKRELLEGMPKPEYSKISVPPPPHPPNVPGVSKKRIHEGNIRMAIMSELREMFVKKDLTRKAES